MILPDVRGLHPYYEELALRFAEHGIDALAIDWFGRTAGPEPRGDDFDYMPHAAQTTWAGIRADITAGGRGDPHARGRPGRARIGVHARLLHGRPDVVPGGTLGLGLAGVIGIYGTLAGPWRNDAPAPVDVARRDRRRRPRPVRRRRHGHHARGDRRLRRGLEAAGVDHRLVTYPGAPHSFFDRKAADFADASAAAWDEVLAFIRARTA